MRHSNWVPCRVQTPQRLGKMIGGGIQAAVWCSRVKTCFEESRDVVEKAKNQITTEDICRLTV